MGTTSPTSLHPPDVIHVMGVPRPSPFFITLPIPCTTLVDRGDAELNSCSCNVCSKAWVFNICKRCHALVVQDTEHMQKCIPYHSLLLSTQVDTKEVKHLRSSSSAFAYNISHPELDGKNVWGTQLEMLHTACQCKGETLSFPVCSCWYIYAGLPI